MLMPEFEGKRLLAAVGVPVPEGRLVGRPAEMAHLPFPFPVAVKAQVAGGGRGRAGGVLRAESLDAAAAAAERILSMRFGDEVPSAVLVEPWLPIRRELYLSVTLDGTAGGFAVLYSPQGGVGVEEAPPPVRYPVGLPRNFRAHEFRDRVAGVEGDPAVREGVVALARSLLRLAGGRDCLTVEVNPLAQLADGSLVAADAKVVRDEAAAFRDSQIRDSLLAARAREPEPVRRCLAGRLMLVKLEGNVGLISGGAGMTLATMDLIRDAGGEPACFLDCSANPTPAGYRLAFDLLDADPRVRAILVSIFGGATQMDRVARVMRDLLRERGGGKPVVFRLDGTNAHAVEAHLQEAGGHNHPTLEAAVRAAVELAGPAR